MEADDRKENNMVAIVKARGGSVPILVLSIVVGVLFAVQGAATAAQGAGDPGKPALSAQTLESPLVARVIEVDKGQQTVSLRLEVPLEGVDARDLAGIKNGDLMVVRLKGGEHGNPSTAVLSPAGTPLALKLSGIRCRECTNRLEASLKAAPGVRNVMMVAKSHEALITYDPAKTNPKDLEKVVDNTEPIHAGKPFRAEEEVDHHYDW